MEWNWNMKNGLIDVTPYLLFESSADSDDPINDVHHHVDHHHIHRRRQEEQVKEQEQEVNDDDAESWTYDNSLHGRGNGHVKSHDKHHQAHGHDDGYHDDHGQGYDHHAHVHDHDDDEEDKYDDDDMNWGDSKMIGQEKRCHELCVDASNLNDRQFWETCLGS